MREYDMSRPEREMVGEEEPQAPSAAPAAGQWQMVSEGDSDGSTYRILQGQFSQVWVGTIPRGHYQLQKWTTAPVPPPAEPELSSFTLAPAQVTAGNPTSAMAKLSAPAGSGIVIALDLPPGVTGPSLIAVKAAQQQGIVGLQTAPEAGGQVSVTATLKGKTLAAPLTIIGAAPPNPNPPHPTPDPGPLPPIERTVDLTNALQDQIQAAIDAARPGTGLYLGPGLYKFPNPSRSPDGQMIDFANKDGVTLYGAGPATQLDFGGKEGIWCRPANVGGLGNCIRDLSITNCRRAVAALDPQRLFVLRLAISNCGIGYASERTGAFDNAMYEWPVVVQDCTVDGWAGHGMMLHGGETVQRCRLSDTPGNQGSTYSHGLYMQGCKNVTIEDLVIENTSGHALQIYSDSATHSANGAENVVLRRVSCRKCFYGPVIAANGLYRGILFEDLVVSGTVSRDGGTFVLSATNDAIEGLMLKNVVLDGGAQGLVLQGDVTGNGAGVIRNLQAQGLTIANHGVGIVIAPPGWPNTKIVTSAIQGYQTQNVAQPVRGSSPGLSIS